MATFSASRPVLGHSPFLFKAVRQNSAHPVGSGRGKWVFLAGTVLFASLVVAQSAPQVTAVDPTSGKVNDTMTLSGSNLGKDSVSSVYLSDDKSDFKATIVSQTSDKISAKVPEVKPGDYNVSIQVGDKLFIKPVKFKVEQ